MNALYHAASDLFPKTDTYISGQFCGSAFSVFPTLIPTSVSSNLSEPFCDPGISSFSAFPQSQHHWTLLERLLVFFSVFIPANSYQDCVLSVHHPASFKWWSVVFPDFPMFSRVWVETSVTTDFSHTQFHLLRSLKLFVLEYLSHCTSSLFCLIAKLILLPPCWLVLYFLSSYSVEPHCSSPMISCKFPLTGFLASSYSVDLIPGVLEIIR